MEETRELRVGQKWRWSNHEHLVITDMTGDTIETVLHDEDVHTSSVMVIRRDDFRALTLLADR